MNDGRQMLEDQQTVLDTFWQQANHSAGAGQNEEARSWLEGIVELDDDNIEAWLRLAELIPDARERMHCYVRVLEISPRNAQARTGIRKTRRELRS